MTNSLNILNFKHFNYQKIRSGNKISAVVHFKDNRPETMHQWGNGDV